MFEGFRGFCCRLSGLRVLEASVPIEVTITSKSEWQQHKKRQQSANTEKVLLPNATSKNRSLQMRT